MLARLAVAASLVATLAGCSPAVVLNAFVPTDALEIRKDIAYGDHPRQRLDVYRPRDGSGPRPVVVFFYGGSWEMGSRESYLFVAEALASRGFAVVVPDYRTYPEVTFPAFLEDGAAAVAWTVDHAAEHGADPQRVFLMGHSAGAHIAAMLALDASYLSRHQLAPSALSGFVGISGPYDFLPLSSETLRKIFAPPEILARTQPINFASSAAPPAFLATGDQDTTVFPRNTIRLAAKLRESGARVVERRYESHNHYTIVGFLAKPLRGGETLLDEIAAFINEEGRRGALVLPAVQRPD